MFAELHRDIWQPFAAAFSRGDAAACVALHSVSLVRGSAEGEIRRVYGRSFLIARKQDGRWKFGVDYDSSEDDAIGAAEFGASHAVNDYAKY